MCGGDAGGNQILFNPRAGDEPFRIVSLRQVMADQVPLDWVQDAVVLIGVTSLSAKDLVNSATLGSKNPGLVYGVEFQAHATSQIISAALDGRPLLEVWPDGLEYSWITVWGVARYWFGLGEPTPGSVRAGRRSSSGSTGRYWNRAHYNRDLGTGAGARDRIYPH